MKGKMFILSFQYCLQAQKHSCESFFDKAFITCLPSGGILAITQGSNGLFDAKNIDVKSMAVTEHLVMKNGGHFLTDLSCFCGLENRSGGFRPFGGYPPPHP